MIRFFISLVLCALLLPLFSGCDNFKVYWWSRKAQEAHNEGEYDKAIGLYKQIIELNPDDPTFYWDLGIAYFDKGDIVNTREIIHKLKKMGHKDFAGKMEEQLRKSEHTIQRRAGDQNLKYYDMGY